MADLSKRPEVTVSTMGKVHNPTGEGVRAISSQAQAKAAKHANSSSSLGGDNSNHSGGGGGDINGNLGHHHGNDPVVVMVKSDAGTSTSDNKALLKVTPADYAKETHETKVKEGTAKRNITRKKTADRDSGHYDSAHKKQGGHGKGQWKEVMDPAAELEMVSGPVVMDERDPLYDETEDSAKYILTSATAADGAVAAGEKRGYDPGTSKAIYGPMLTLPEFKIQLNLSLQEYFDSCDADEVIRSLQELKCQEYHSETVKKAISLAMDKGPRERELTSRLLTCLHPTPLSMQDMEVGFEALLDAMDDLSKDVPDASTMVASFLARAVVDEVLPPAFLSEQNNSRPGDVVVEKAVSLLSREHCTARLERVWGPGDGRPVSELKVEMDQLLQEYLLSRELDEAARCVKELEAPHFHHELVKRGVFLAMELDGKEAAAVKERQHQHNHHPSSSEDDKKEEENGGGNGGDAAKAQDEEKNKQDDSSTLLSNIDAMAALFGFLVRNAIVSEYQVKKGVSRLHALLPDLTLDVPAAPSLLEAFEEMVVEREGLAVIAATTNKNNCGGSIKAASEEPKEDCVNQQQAEGTGEATTTAT